MIQHVSTGCPYFSIGAVEGAKVKSIHKERVAPEIPVHCAKCVKKEKDDEI